MPIEPPTNYTVFFKAYNVFTQLFDPIGNAPEDPEAEQQLHQSDQEREKTSEDKSSNDQIEEEQNDDYNEEPEIENEEVELSKLEEETNEFGSESNQQNQEQRENTEAYETIQEVDLQQDLVHQDANEDDDKDVILPANNQESDD